jgi:hypothetical protein
MKAESNPSIRVDISLSIEIEYDPFKGKPVATFVQCLEDDIVDMLLDGRPDILSLVTSIQQINEPSNN